jgi:broad specificity phosphatase PhoE
MTADIILVRHGRTRSNVTLHQMGRSAEDLDSEGLIQAQKISTRLASLPIASIYSSPLQRTLSTARTIAAPHNQKVQVLDDLSEIDFGEWQGLHVSDIEKRWPELWTEWRRDPSQMKVPGGETFEHVAERVSRALKTVIAQNPEAISLIVTHEIVIKMVMIQVLEAPLSIYRHFVVGNASLSLVRVHQNPPQVITINDRFHLEG